ncbi:hypothetical protein HJG60_009062 [Phyllostomus discolor]|uniref:Retroviral envelope protein GP41-like domain-containing protein n=1 Tax=Phyllostomus discolor TaxID=89673 RepID=A0A833YQ98_9CHIR|nr:hypothetical protein HJG60_009062 [Phyllostomus discolor]
MHCPPYESNSLIPGCSYCLISATLELVQQAQIDQEVLTCLSTVESALDWIGERQDALVTRQLLTCDPGFSRLCVTPLQWNSSQHTWTDIQHHLRGAFSTNLKGEIDKLQLELHQQLQDIQCLTKQDIFRAGHFNENISWMNPKTWFDGINLRI